MMKKPLIISSLIEHAARYHGKTGVISVETDTSLTRSNWREVEENSRRLASALEKLGIKQGDRCATIAWNNRRHLEIYFGVSGAGMICHTINPRLHPEQLIYIVNHAEDRVLFVDRTFLPAVAKLRDHLKTLEHIVLMGPRDDEAAAMLPGLMFYDDLLATGMRPITGRRLTRICPRRYVIPQGPRATPRACNIPTARRFCIQSAAISRTDWRCRRVMW